MISTPYFASLPSVTSDGSNFKICPEMVHSSPHLHVYFLNQTSIIAEQDIHNLSGLPASMLEPYVLYDHSAEVIICKCKSRHICIGCII